MTDSKNHQDITPDSRQGVRQHSQTFIAQISSPLPPPEMLVGYECAQPGLGRAHLIIKIIPGISTFSRSLRFHSLFIRNINRPRGYIIYV